MNTDSSPPSPEPTLSVEQIEEWRGWYKQRAYIFGNARVATGITLCDLALRAAQAPQAGGPDLPALVNRFLAWPLPKTVRSDLCVTMNYPYPRSGTNLLTADEAQQMIEYLLTLPEPPQ